MNWEEEYDPNWPDVIDAKVAIDTKLRGNNQLIKQLIDERMIRRNWLSKKKNELDWSRKNQEHRSYTMIICEELKEKIFIILQYLYYNTESKNI